MVQRWLYSTNAKDIAVLYFMIALFSGMAGTAMSMIIRLELAAPGSQYLAGNNQLFNVLVVGHAVLMIFFLVMPALIGGFGKINLYNNYYIKYNYNNNNIYYINIINKLINRLNININNLSNILSYYYNKKVIIEPIKLKYLYNNNEIITKYISLLDNNKYNNGLLIEYQRLLNNIMPKLNDHNISINYINNINK